MYFHISRYVAFCNILKYLLNVRIPSKENKTMRNVNFKKSLSKPLLFPGRCHMKLVQDPLVWPWASPALRVMKSRRDFAIGQMPILLAWGRPERPSF